ncbi:unnamed protein product [Heterobilharzia americana]|nr:unnamed protein product [Heterobilharzia americana]
MEEHNGQLRLSNNLATKYEGGYFKTEMNDNQPYKPDPNSNKPASHKNFLRKLFKQVETHHNTAKQKQSCKANGSWKFCDSLII